MYKLGQQENKTLFDQLLLLLLLSFSTGNFMAQSNPEESGLFSMFSDLFAEKPQPQPTSQSKPPPQPDSQPQPESQPKPKPPPQRKLKSIFNSKKKEGTPTPSERQDELVRKFPGSKISRRPNPMEEADDTTYIKFPNENCERYMKKFYEAVRLYGRDCEINGTTCLYTSIIRKSCGIAVYYPEDNKK